MGAIAAVMGTILLLVKAAAQPDISPVRLSSCLLFGLSMVALYTSSAVYHYSNLPEGKRLILRKLDHSVIYVLIAGTYTPLLLNFLSAPGNLYFTAFIWAIAIAGIAMKLLWFSAPRWLQTTLYIAMGWMIVIDPSIFPAMGPIAVTLLACGGVSYTIGGLIYIAKKPNPTSEFGFHEIFHCFVLLGSLCHYLVVFLFVA